MRSTSRRAISCTCITLLDSPNLPGLSSVVLASGRDGLRKNHLYANYPVRNIKGGAVRIQSLIFPFQQKGSYSGCSIAGRPPTFVFTGRVFEPGCLRLSFCFVFLPFAFESRASHAFSLQFSVTLCSCLGCFPILLLYFYLHSNMYQVLAQSEHVVDPH